MKFVLDASAILSGKDFPAHYELYSSPRILEEIQHGRMRRRLDYLIESGLQVMSPTNETIEEVRQCARDTGDIARVSESDIEILSLAKELDCVLLTDDYSIQNLASKLDVEFKGKAQEEITHTIKWSFRCKGCGRYWDEMHDSCPVCGSGRGGLWRVRRCHGRCHQTPPPGTTPTPGRRHRRRRQVHRRLQGYQPGRRRSRSQHH